MKNVMLFVSPHKDFLPEHKVSIKIQIDNSLELGWKKEDIILATNFPYEYNGITSFLVSDTNFASFCPTVTLINVIVELFDRNVIEKNEVYWYHDGDAYQQYEITESELNLGFCDMALSYKGLKTKWDTGSIFFKDSAEDIFREIKEIANKYETNEEYVLMALYTNNLLWITKTETDARDNFVPLYPNAPVNWTTRIKTLNLSYLFGAEHDQIYNMANKPIKVIHFHFTDDLQLDSIMYGKNMLKKVFMPERLMQIFHRHGVKGTFPKKMKNLMIYVNPRKKLTDREDSMIKSQIDNSLELGWEKEDVIFITNFPYEYQGVTATIVDKDMFVDNAMVSGVISYLLEQGEVGEAELWWYHDFDIFQLSSMDSSEIDLQGATAGFSRDLNTFNMKSFFFRKGSRNLFGWVRNKTRRLKATESSALDSLSSINYRKINYLYTKIEKPEKMLQVPLVPKHNTQMIPERLAKILSKHSVL